MDIIHQKKIWFSISAAIILVGLVMALLTGVNAGIDFTGGTLMEFELHQSASTDEIRSITDAFDTSASINFIGSDQTTLQIRTIEDLDHSERMEVFRELETRYEITEDDFLRAEQFGPAIGREIRDRAFLSMLIAAVGMLIYITFRFEFSFGIAAIIALFHDILVVLAVYVIFRIPLNSPFVAAMLTVLGYSINDTIVVFDRIRENRKTMKKFDFEQLATNSINQTIKRSVYTSLTTLVMILALYIMGVPQIREFALPLIAGIVSGTYSSIFIASPVWVMIKERTKDRNKMFAKA
ncbi:protein translocase subunit SecF [Anoxynatronum buryatiense]|uniref:Protein-export membrane protein SecF n=1 Tax=Anoxynatronum buryatiense TaxID=489973 RepID=A0AA45WVN8_9CLOT|nr:protein translocase subunit SecF [Anoxynatronum buryatiense]SMP49371.1 preprotein translocase subunit SecF [Anoxynatronum buryatiense]